MGIFGEFEDDVHTLVPLVGEVHGCRYVHRKVSGMRVVENELSEVGHVNAKLHYVDWLLRGKDEAVGCEGT